MREEVQIKTNRGPFIFYMQNYVLASELKAIREDLMRQLEEGCVVLPANIELLYWPDKEVEP